MSEASGGETVPATEREPWLVTPQVCGECGGERDIDNRCPNNFHLSSDVGPELDRPLHHPIGYDADETPFDCEECGQPWPCAFRRAEDMAGELADLRQKCALVMADRDDARATLETIWSLVDGPGRVT